MILPAGAVAPQRMAGSSPRTEERFDDVAGLRLFGVNIVTLAPGERSAKPHWHSGSDEFAMVLTGTATVIENGAETQIAAGGLALWRAGDETAHQIVNRSDAPLRYLCAGTNPTHETVRYPDDRETLVYEHPHWEHPHWHIITDDGAITRSGQEE